MHIGPSLGLLQALGSQPGAVEPARVRPTVQVEATAPLRRATASPAPSVRAAEANPQRDAPADALSGQRPGQRLDIRV